MSHVTLSTQSSRWESLPFDILTSVLPYLNLENPKVIDSLCADSYINSKLQCSDPNGYLWKYLFAHFLSHNLPSSNLSLRDLYYEYLTEKEKESINRLLVYAAQNGYEILVQRLVNEGADIHAYDDSALSSAALEGHLDIVKYLVEHGADVRADDDKALLIAAANGHLDVVKYLVSQGASIHEGGEEPLKTASANGYLDVVKYLVSQGANIHTLTDRALRYAFMFNRTDIVDYLTSLP